VSGYIFTEAFINFPKGFALYSGSIVGIIYFRKYRKYTAWKYSRYIIYYLPPTIVLELSLRCYQPRVKSCGNQTRRESEGVARNQSC